MEEARFWALVDLLDGVADDASVARLASELRPDEAEPFLDHVYARVGALLERCEVPASHAGDTAEWIAAAVVAAGRTTYERTLTAGGRLDPEAWAWGEAEALLVTGVGENDTDEEGEDGEDGEGSYVDEDDDLAAALTEKLGLSLRWCSTDVAAGVVTNFDPAADTGDDPDQAAVWTLDDEWTTTLAVLDGDPEFHRRRTALSAVGLHLVVRDAEEATLMAWPNDEEVSDVVMVVPVEVVLTAPSRHDAYLEAVVTLVSAVGEALGTPS